MITNADSDITKNALGFTNFWWH